MRNFEQLLQTKPFSQWAHKEITSRLTQIMKKVTEKLKEIKHVKKNEMKVIIKIDTEEFL